MSKRKKQQKKKRTTEAAVNVARLSVPCVVARVLSSHASLPFVVVVLLVALETFLFVLCSVRARCCVLRFCNRISGRVGLGQPNTYRAKNKKKGAIPPLMRFCDERHGYGGRHPQPTTPPLFGGVFSENLRRQTAMALP